MPNILCDLESVADFISPFARLKRMHALAGGILDSSDCTQAQPARQIARLGDVCVSPYALNWNCKLADYSEQVWLSSMAKSAQHAIENLHAWPCNWACGLWSCPSKPHGQSLRASAAHLAVVPRAEGITLTVCAQVSCT